MAWPVDTQQEADGLSSELQLTAGTGLSRRLTR